MATFLGGRSHVASSVTYGNAKSADVVAINPETDKAAVIEVKTSAKNRWPIGRKVPEPSNKLWVFISLREEISEHPEYFILTQEELHNTLKPEEDAYYKRYKEKHGVEYGDRPSVARLTYQQAEKFKNKWSTIVRALKT